MATPARDLIVAAFQALDLVEQEQALAKLHELRLARLAGAEGETARFLDSLERVQKHVGRELSPALYRQARRELAAEGVVIEEFNRVCRYFGTWTAAKAALGRLSVTTAMKIEAGYRARLYGRPRAFGAADLAAALAECVADLGRVPTVAEYSKFRQRVIDLARARGETVFIPSPAPYRRRFGSFAAALRHHGYEPRELELRYEQR